MRQDCLDLRLLSCVHSHAHYVRVRVWGCFNFGWSLLVYPVGISDSEGVCVFVFHKCWITSPPSPPHLYT